MQSSPALARPFDRALSRAALLFIRLYRRWLSPIKGYRCAHNHVHRSGTCSQFGLRAVESQGFIAGLHLTRHRLRECRAAAQTLHHAAQSEQRPDQAHKEKGRKRTSRRCDFSTFACVPFELPAACGTRGAAGVGGAGGAAEGCSGVGAIGDCAVRSHVCDASGPRLKLERHARNSGHPEGAAYPEFAGGSGFPLLRE